uniref:Gustatory receptor n=1 Tax=Strigamia maritima TaxID=126957 RepID=T1JJH9_STRMM
MEYNEDLSTVKINRLWRYLYIYYGFLLSEHTCCFAVFVTVHILANAADAVLRAIPIFNNVSVITLCNLFSVLVYWIQACVCTIVLRKKRYQFSHYLNQLLKMINVVYKKRAWISLQRLMIFTFISLISSFLTEMIFFISFNDFSSSFNAIVIIANWLTILILNEIAKILFIYFCVLIILNFECLMTKVENATVFFSSLTKRKLFNYQHQFYKILQRLDDVNKLFNPLLAAWITGDIIYICLSLRIAINSISEFSFVTLYTVRTLVVLLIIYYYAARVNEKARATAVVITVLTDLQQNNHSPKMTYSSSSHVHVDNWKDRMFIQHLSLDSTGIDVSGYFIITKGSILTFIGTLLTYVVLLLQTK